MGTLALELAQWSSGLAIGVVPAPVKEAAKRAFIDTCGVMIAGATDEIAQTMREWVSARPRPGASVVPPYGLTADPENSALALGVLAHALDFDDIHPAVIGHPSSVLIPVILALGSSINVSGEKALTAYVAGAEVAAHIGRAAAVPQYHHGWHTTSTIGVLAAAVSAAYLLELDPEATAEAIGLAASTASGLRANFGSSAKPLHAGYAAYHGVVAALLARAGLRAASGALDGPLGYLDSFSGNRHAADGIAAGLGIRWELIDPGLQVKPYPCCGGAHRSIDSLLDLVLEHHLEADEIESVTALVDPVVPTLLVYPEPRTVAEARFSLHHTLACVMADRRLSLEHFSASALSRQDLARLRRRVEISIHPELVQYKGELTFSEVRVVLRDGSSLSRRTDFPRGSGRRPLSQSELESKFFDCVRLYAPHHNWVPALQVLRNLDADGTVQTLVDTLVVAE